MREPLCYPGIGQILKRRGDQAGIEGLRPHILRHTWCHYQLDGGTGDSNVITSAGWVEVAYFDYRSHVVPLITSGGQVANG